MRIAPHIRRGRHVIGHTRHRVALTFHFLCYNQRVLYKQHIKPSTLVVLCRTPVHKIVRRRRTHHIILFASVNFFYSHSCHISTSFAVHNSTTGWRGSPERIRTNLADYFSKKPFFALLSYPRA